jgi:hypothetical protein
LFLSTFLAFTQTGTRIKIKIEHLNGQYAALWSYYGDEEFFVDSIRFGENGLANYYNKNGLQKGLYKIVLPNTNLFELIITEPKIVVRTDLVTPNRSMIVKKSEENRQYYAYKKYVSNQRVAMSNLISLHKDGELTSVLFDEQSASVNHQIMQYKLDLIKSSKGLLLSDLLKAGMNPAIDTTVREPYVDYLNKYLDQIDFNNTALLYSPVMDRRTVEYVDLLVAPYPQEKIGAIKTILVRCDSNSKVQTYFVERFIENYEKLQTVGYDEIFNFLVVNYIENTSYSDERKIMLRNKSMVVGKFLRGEQFELDGIQKNELLDSIDSKYTLVIVWNSNTSTKKLELIYDFSQTYEKYGLKVFSIGLDGDLSVLNIGQKHKWVNVDGKGTIKDELLMEDDLILILLDSDKKVLARDISLDFLVDTLNAWEK